MNTKLTTADAAGHQRDRVHPWVAVMLASALLATWLLGYGPGGPTQLPWPALRALSGASGDVSTKSAASTGAVTSATTAASAPTEPNNAVAVQPAGAASSSAGVVATEAAAIASSAASATAPAPDVAAGSTTAALPASPVPAEPLTVPDAKAAAAAPAVAQVFFPRANASLPKGVGRSLAGVVRYLNANASATVAVAGFHDSYGDPARNAELARKRAQAVAGVLERQGIDKQRIALQKPEKSLGSGRTAQARRVEVRVVPG